MPHVKCFSFFFWFCYGSCSTNQLLLSAKHCAIHAKKKKCRKDAERQNYNCLVESTCFSSSSSSFFSLIWNLTFCLFLFQLFFLPSLHPSARVSLRWRCRERRLCRRSPGNVTSLQCLRRFACMSSFLFFGSYFALFVCCISFLSKYWNSATPRSEAHVYTRV